MRCFRILSTWMAVIGCFVFFSNDPADSKSRFAEKEKIVVALSTQVLTLDPVRSAGTPAEMVRRHLYEGLVYGDSQNRIYPHLAEKWEVSKDGLTWTFYLKKGVKFHDLSPFTAHAVKKSFDRLLDLGVGSNRRYMYTFIDQIKVIDDYTVQIITKEPKANFLNLLTESGAFPISPAALDKYGKDIADNPCGTGPFKLQKKVTGEYVTLSRFDEHWKGRPRLSEIKFVTVPEEATRVTMIENGEADFIVNVPPQDMKRLEGDRDLTIRKDQSNRVAHIGLNVRKPPFDNPKVRQALNYGVDRELIIRGVCNGVGIPAKSIIAPATWGYASISPYSYDPEKAKDLLAQAGYAKGFKAKLWTPQGRYFRDKETALAVAGQLRKVGVELDVEVIDWGQYLKELKLGLNEGNKTEAYMLGWESITGEASYIINTVFASKNAAPAGWNTMFYTNPRLDEINEVSSKTMDDRKRAELFKEAQEIAVREAAWIPLYVYEQVSAHRSDLKGIGVLPMEVAVFNDAYIAK
jgi:ABC-type transport system substrate-binding protein